MPTTDTPTQDTTLTSQVDALLIDIDAGLIEPDGLLRYRLDRVLEDRKNTTGLPTVIRADFTGKVVDLDYLRDACARAGVSFEYEDDEVAAEFQGTPKSPGQLAIDLLFMVGLGSIDDFEVASTSSDTGTDMVGSFTHTVWFRGYGEDFEKAAADLRVIPDGDTMEVVESMIRFGMLSDSDGVEVNDLKITCLF